MAFSGKRCVKAGSSPSSIRPTIDKKSRDSSGGEGVNQMNAIHVKASLDEAELAASVLGRMATDLSMIMDREFVVEDAQVERRTQRPVGGSQVHLSFKLGIEVGGWSRQGCLLVPLPDAIALAAFLMMLPDGEVAQERHRTELDGPFKEALLEVGKFLAGACDSVLRPALPLESTTRSDGCQGVRANVRPALSYSEGDELLVVRARARVHDFEPFELILTLPTFAGGALAEVLSS